MTTVTCKIPDELDARLTDMARRARLPKARILRRVLEQAAPKRSRNGTAFSVVADLCGSLTGPADLATNPKYLEGLGA